MARSWQHFRDEVDLAAHATRRAERPELRPGPLALVLQPLLRPVLQKLGGLVRKRLYAYGDIFATRRPPRSGHRGLERKRARLGSLTLTRNRTPNPNPNPNLNPNLNPDLYPKPQSVCPRRQQGCRRWQADHDHGQHVLDAGPSLAHAIQRVHQRARLPKRPH